jgi:NADP-dependent 3-hydroxy acid dehydrogenase YdfG
MVANYSDLVCCTEALLGSMLARGSGQIVNSASVTPSFGVVWRALDFASKFTMLGFSQSPYHEPRMRGVYGSDHREPDCCQDASLAAKCQNYIDLTQRRYQERDSFTTANSLYLEIIVPFM